MKIDADTQLGVLYGEYELAMQENALKLKQILDLEDILYVVRIMDLKDDSPCWCAFPVHKEYCVKARNATQHLWKKNEE